MEVPKLKEFNPDKLKAVISKKVRYGEREFTSIRFYYAGSDVPAIRVDGSFRLFNFNSDEKVTYSLVIKCGNNEDSFQKLCRVLSRESSKITNEKQNFELVKVTKVEARWYMERYTQSLMAKLNVEYLSTLLKT